MLSKLIKKTILLAAILLLAFAQPASTQQEVVDLKFSSPPVSDSDTSRTLQSLVKVQGTGGPCQKGLYLMTHYGDREDLFQAENQSLVDNPLVNQTWRYCSVFSAATDSSVIMGRNWDNENVGSIIVSLYRPPEGYSSISFSRAIDMGFPLNMDPEELKSGDMGNKLLLAPFYAMDGINEHGLAVAIAGVRTSNHSPKSAEERVFVTFLIRKILDQARTVEEAVSLAERYVPFTLDMNSCSGHFLIVASSGQSMVLEYDQDQWRSIYPDESWQVLTNKPVFTVPDADLREKCRRYARMSETLERADGNLNWITGLNVLQDVAQKGTTWSVIYGCPALELYFSVYQNWDTIYHLRIP